MAVDQFRADVTRLTSNDDGWRDPKTCPIIAIHTYECPRSDDVEARADWQNSSRTGSYHILVGTRRTLRANDDDYIPWAAGRTGNRRGFHLSFLAYASSRRGDWIAADNQLELGAAVVADWCRRYSIPVVKLSAEEVRAGKRGICGHGDVSAAWKESDHTDPGVGFPWDVFLEKVKRRVEGQAGMTAVPGVPAAVVNDMKVAAGNAVDNRTQLRGPADNGWKVDALVEAARKRDAGFGQGTLAELLAVTLKEIRELKSLMLEGMK